jgi:hypothetical protein
LTLRERLAEAAEQRQKALDTVGRCMYAERLVTGCCERQYRCHHADRDGNVYEPRQCNCTCPDFRQGWKRQAGPGRSAAEASPTVAVGRA